MKSTSILYECGVNNGSVGLITMDKEYFDLSIAGFQGETELNYLTKDELVELGEFLISVGKGKE